MAPVNEFTLEFRVFTSNISQALIELMELRQVTSIFSPAVSRSITEIEFKIVVPGGVSSSTVIS